MSPSISRFTAAALLVLAGPTLACGPSFPSTIIDNHEGLLAAPFLRFAASVAKIPGPPPAFRAVNPARMQGRDDQSRAIELAELAAAGVPVGIIRQHEVRRATLARIELPSPGQLLPAELARTDGLPAEFALYHAGVFHIAQNDAAVAVENFRQLLALDAASRRYKSTWAAFMLGRLYEPEAPEKARGYYQQVRQLAQAGFRDPLGLAAASYGREAKTYYDADDLVPAARLYLEQAATGDETAADSLRFLARRLLMRGSDEEVRIFAEDPRLREIPTALLLAERDGWRPGADQYRDARRWLAALEQTGVRDQANTSRLGLALAAYRFGQFSTCERWLRLAPPDEGLALWLRAKLALRDGEIDQATELLARLVRQSADRSLTEFAVFEQPDYPPAHGPAHIRAELGALKLARHEYADALSLLIEAGYDEDAAYIADRVLTVDELKAFVETQFPAIHVLQRGEPRWDRDRATAGVDFRALLARRLVRHDRLEEARPFFPPAMAAIFDRFREMIRVGRNPSESTIVRSVALMEAARTLKAQGMELRGTELFPDFTIWGGANEYGDLLVRRVNLPGQLRATTDEYSRASIPDPGVLHRFHYRYLAADLAWEAISLMPDQQETTAAALIEAGSWLKNRDPRAANRFYVALVLRCGTTTKGRIAAARHWFP